MRSYYVEQKGWTIGDSECRLILSKNNEDVIGWKQYFQRAWTALDFNSPVKALEYIRSMYPGESYFLNEEHSKILVLVSKDYIAESFILTHISNDL